MQRELPQDACKSNRRALFPGSLPFGLLRQGIEGWKDQLLQTRRNELLFKTASSNRRNVMHPWALPFRLL
jgi:hypothetical protein